MPALCLLDRIRPEKGSPKADSPTGVYPSMEDSIMPCLFGSLSCDPLFIFFSRGMDPSSYSFESTDEAPEVIDYRL